ncbi:MAG: hypothetical protein RJB65_1587, partial [Actinomycetota bacterium]
NVAVATGTALSRLTGLARVAVLGAVLGTPSAVADAYDLANGTPNIIYELLLGGVLSSSLVPLFTRLREDDDEEGTSAVVSVAVVALTALTIIAVAAAPLVFRLYSMMVSDNVDADQYRSVGTALARLFLVQIFFYGINALASALLNARGRFFAAAWAPVLSNVVIVGSLALVPAMTDSTPTLADVLAEADLRWVLGGGATLGIAVMALSLLPAAAAAGVRIRPRLDLRHPAVRQLRSLSGWALGYVAANQVAILVVRNLLRGGDGSIFAYSRAYMWFVLPHGLLAMSIATTFLPEMTRAVRDRDRVRLAERTSLGVRLIALVTMPAGVGLFVLRRPIIGLAFQHGNVSAADAETTARALAGFSLGLVGVSVFLFVVRLFYAHLDARTPFTLNLVENVLNVGLAIVLVDRYGILGLALSFAIAYLVSAALALVVARNKVPELALGPIAAALGRMVIASAVMGEAVWWVARQVGGNVGLDAVIRVLAGSLTGVVVYVVILAALRAPELDALLRRRRA